MHSICQCLTRTMPPPTHRTRPQDTGGVLLDLLGLLRPRHLTVVGDDDQSI